MKKVGFILLLIAGAFTFERCSTDVDLYADYKDIPIVYSILDYAGDTIWVKVTRAFNGPGDILQFAKNPDSSNYPYKLDITLIGHIPGGDLPEIKFDTITIKNKKAGDSIFYYPDQLMYYSVAKLNKDATYYRLDLNIKGKEVTAETPLVNSLSVSRPRNIIDFTRDGNIEWISTKNGKLYEVTYVFHYTELNPGSHDTLQKQVSYYVGNKTSLNTEGGEDMSVIYSGDGFYDKLASELPDIPNVQRWAGNVVITVSAGSQVLQNYLQINNASGNLLEEVPLYTNINNGMGIFASRHSGTHPVRLSSKSQKKLVEDMNLGFKYPAK